ncbi:MAG: hypothetical protein HYW47_00845 [Deltaproteobacteria bacterium]|nr:hypothetical protein [Deltaproteobacteria bacterium]
MTLYKKGPLLAVSYTNEDSFIEHPQLKNGADFLYADLDIFPGNQEDFCFQTVETLKNFPLIINSQNKELLGKILEVQPGEYILKSLDLEDDNLHNFAPFIGLCCSAIVVLLRQKGDNIEPIFPKNMNERKNLIEYLEKKVSKYSLPKEGIIIDPAITSLESYPQHKEDVLKTISLLKEKGFRTIASFLNIVDGNEEKEISFFKEVLESGLDIAIFDPSNSKMKEIFFSLRC